MQSPVSEIPNDNQLNIASQAALFSGNSLLITEFNLENQVELPKPKRMEPQTSEILNNSPLKIDSQANPGLLSPESQPNMAVTNMIELVSKSAVSCPSIKILNPEWQNRTAHMRFGNIIEIANEGKVLLKYSSTKKVAGKWYMQCLNRFRGETTDAKCLATAHYYPET